MLLVAASVLVLEFRFEFVVVVVFDTAWMSSVYCFECAASKSSCGPPCYLSSLWAHQRRHLYKALVERC